MKRLSGEIIQEQQHYLLSEKMEAGTFHKI
jgi:hypothetical protein